MMCAKFCVKEKFSQKLKFGIFTENKRIFVKFSIFAKIEKNIFVTTLHLTSTVIELTRTNRNTRQRGKNRILIIEIYIFVYYSFIYK
jgi:hypothetical protein